MGGNWRYGEVFRLIPSARLEEGKVVARGVPAVTIRKSSNSSTPADGRWKQRLTVLMALSRSVIQADDTGSR